LPAGTRQVDGDLDGTARLSQLAGYIGYLLVRCQEGFDLGGSRMISLDSQSAVLLDTQLQRLVRPAAGLNQARLHKSRTNRINQFIGQSSGIAANAVFIDRINTMQHIIESDRLTDAAGNTLSKLCSTQN